MPSHLKSIWRRGQRDPSTFSIHVGLYASTVWAHLKINEQLIFHIHGLHREKCIMDPLALSYPLTNINIHIQYGSNLIMSFRVKILRMIILFGGILVNLFFYSGVPKYQRRPQHN